VTKRCAIVIFAISCFQFPIVFIRDNFIELQHLRLKWLALAI